MFDKMVSEDDLVLLTVTGILGSQRYCARIGRVYSAGKGVEATAVGTDIEFIGGSGWGDVPLAVGERGLVFVRAVRGRLYERSHHGHMVLEEIDGDTYASHPVRDYWLHDAFPEDLRAYSRQDPKRPYATAIRFDVLETYLIGLIQTVRGDEAQPRD